VKRAIALGALCVAFAACNQNAGAPTAMPGMTGMPTGMPGTAAIPGMPMTVAMPQTAAGPAAEPTSANLPIPEDFEEEAQAQVQEANFRAELDRIDHEVEAAQ